MLTSIPLNGHCSNDYFDMLCDMFVVMETKETTILDEKDIFPDGRPSSVADGDCDLIPAQLQLGQNWILG